LAEWIEQFIAYKRSLGRRYEVEAKPLRLLDRYLYEHAVEQPDQLPRTHARPDLAWLFGTACSARESSPATRHGGKNLTTMAKFFESAKIRFNRAESISMTTSGEA